jgi:hypothetical protein
MDLRAGLDTLAKTNISAVGNETKKLRPCSRSLVNLLTEVPAQCFNHKCHNSAMLFLSQAESRTLLVNFSLLFSVFCIVLTITSNW